MKRILSLILVVSMFLSVTAFGAITTTEIYTDTETGYTYIFGKFEDSDTNVGFEINGKEYDLMKEDVNNPSKTAFEVAKEKGNIFGIGFLDATQKGAEEKKFTATPFTYNAENAKNTQEAITVDLPEYDNLKLKDIKVNGETVAAFSPYKSYYYYETNDVSSITKEDIEATAQAAYANVTVSDAGNNNYVITTTAPDSEEAKTVEIRVREKGEPQNPEEQVAPFKGSKFIKFISEEDMYFHPTTGDSGIYDQGDWSLKASGANKVLHATDTSYGVYLAQFDISNITNVNDRVILNIPAYKQYSADAEIGFMAVDNELPILYHNWANRYYNGSSSTQEYQDYLALLRKGEVTTPSYTNIGADEINQEIKNAYAMVDYKNIEKDIAERVVLKNSAEETKNVDVTDYVKSKLENGDETVTFMIRAIKNKEIDPSAGEVKVRVKVETATLSFTKFEGEIVASDIKVNGETIQDFNKDTLNYSVILEGTTAPTVTATVADTENLTVKVTQATEVPGAATVKVTSYDGQSKTYTINFDNPFEKGVFTFDLDASKRVEFNWGASYNKISAVKNLKNTNYWIRTYGNSSGYVVPKETALITFNTTTQGLNEDDRIYLNLYVKGFDPYATSVSGVPGGKVKVIYTQSSIDVNSQVDKTNYVVSSNYITSENTEFKIDVTNLVKNALLNTNAVDGIKTIQLLIETDEADVQKTTTGNYIYSDNTVSYEHTNLGGILQLDTYSPTITYAE